MLCVVRPYLMSLCNGRMTSNTEKFDVKKIIRAIINEGLMINGSKWQNEDGRMFYSPCVSVSNGLK